MEEEEDLLMRFIVGVKFYMEVSSETSNRGGGVIM